MRLSIFVLCLLTTLTASAADDLTILKVSPDGGSPRAMLSTYLKSEVQKALDSRRAAVASLKTPEDVARRQRELKSRFVDALGGFPEKTPLKARVIASEDHDGYRLERVIYESRPDHHVTALFYLPTGTTPYPAVLIPCGHDANGKAAPNYQRACVSLARSGIASLCYDPISQGERRQLLDKEGRPAGMGNTTEHTLIGIGALLIGRCTASYRVWDGIRSLDYLASRPEIDPKRLGCTGCSGGGTLTSYLMALDDRIAAAAPSCYITSLERLFATLGPQDAEQNIPGQVAYGMDHADYLGMRAPKPTLIMASTNDFFDIQGTWTTFRESKRLYGLLGHPERVDLIEANEKHGYVKEHREAMLRWMRRWLLGKDDAATEPDEIAIARDAEIQCTKSGQVIADLRGKSVFDINAERADELARTRVEYLAKHEKSELLGEVRRLIALPDSIAPARREDRGEIKRPGGLVRKLVFTTEPGIEVPAFLTVPDKLVGDAPLKVIVGSQHSELIDSGQQIEYVLRSGQRILFVDLRGMGETAPAPKRSGPFGVEVEESFLSLHLARPLLGQRVFDLLSVLAAMADESREGFAITGQGTSGPIALHAAALGHKVVSLSLQNSISSWTDVVRTPLSRDQLSNAVPGALTYYDLPDLAAALAPRSLKIINPVDPAGQAASRESIEAAYAPTKRAYRAKGAENQLELIVDR